MFSDSNSFGLVHGFPMFKETGKNMKMILRTVVRDGEQGFFQVNKLVERYSNAFENSQHIMLVDLEDGRKFPLTLGTLGQRQ